MKSLLKCVADIKKSKNIAIITHTTPDADALCSAIALKKLIRQNQNENSEPKQIDIFVDADEIGERNLAIVKGIELNVQNCENYDLVISVDCASLSRMGKYSELFQKYDNTINIDHHTTNDNFAKNNIVLITSSTCEGLYLLAKSQNAKISDDVCKLIYSGIITDTNNLTQGTITVNTHKVIAEIIGRKINVEALNDYFFKNNTKNKAFLLKQALDSLTFIAGDRIAFMKLTKQDLAECEATFDDTLGIVNHGIEIKGVDIAILAIKQEDNSYYVSLRGKNNISVANIAKAMGGGGHETVAAFQYNGLLADMKDQLLKACKDELANHTLEDIENIFYNDDDDELENKNM